MELSSQGSPLSQALRRMARDGEADGTDQRLPAGGRDRRRTFWAVAAAFMLERADENVLPSTFDGLGASLHANPQQLGYLSLSRGLAMSLVSPLGGLLGHVVDRKLVVVAGCALWGSSTCLMASCGSVAAGAFMCAINGIGIALVMPAGQSLVADYYTDSDRGRAYGGIGALQAFGAMFGVVVATNVGARAWFGLAGWRAAWILIGLCGLLVAILFAAVAKSPNMGKDDIHLIEPSVRMQLRLAMTAVRGILRCPSFIIIVAQGIVGLWPIQALNYTMLYLELLHISKFHSSLIAAGFLAGAALGGMLGGFVGDRASMAFPNHGRILVSSLSTLLAVPWCFIFFKGLPRLQADAHAGLYAIVLFSAGLSMTWMGIAGKQPICAEIVPPEQRHLIFSLSRFFEGTPSALGAPLVGWTAQTFFGYEGLATTSQECASQDCEESQRSMSDREKADALGSAMLLMTAGPWFFCALIWSGLHLTYRRDRQRAASVPSKASTGTGALDTAEEEQLLELAAVTS